MTRILGAVLLLLTACSAGRIVDEQPTTTTVAVVSSFTTLAIPQPVIPPDAVRIATGDSIQSIVDQHPAGTVYVVESGIHLRQHVIPKAGDVFIGEPETILDGGGETPHAFSGDGGDDVVIRGLEIRNYETPLNSGTIKGGNSSHGWLVEGNEIHSNGGAGVSAGPNWIVRGNYIHHNQQFGIVGAGGNILIEGNEISFNNPDLEVSPHWGAGGSKWVHTKGLVVRGNYSHDNGGPGLWTDGHNIDTTYDDNVVVNNLHAGIKHEISCDAVISDNVAEGNGFGVETWVDGAGILVINSPNVEVHDNIVRNNNDGVGGVQSDRDDVADLCPLELRNFNVHHNTIIMEVGQNGVATNMAESGVLTDWNNRYEDNTYTLGSESEYYRWGNPMDVDAWRDLGNDENGTWQ